MIWLTWRQFRTQAVVAAAALAVLAVVLLITGLHVAHAYDASQVPGCGAHHDCTNAAQNYIQSLKNNPLIFLTYYIGLVLVYLVPAIVGAFWGAPLVARELETGTLAMVWNQSVSRSRWLATKLVVLGLSGMAAAGLLSWIMSWWIGPIARAGDYNRNGAGSAVNRFFPILFGAGGIAPLGYAAFAFALGVTAGVLIRRTLPALAVTLAVFAVVQVVMPNVIRPHLIPPVQATSSFNVSNLTEFLIAGGPGQSGAPMTVQAAAEVPGAWLLSNVTITPSGKVFDGPAPQLCMTGTPQACNAWVGRQHLRQRITYQPASRYWDFQWIETAIFLVLGLALAGFSLWRVSRRRLA